MRKPEESHKHRNCEHRCRCAAPLAFKCQKCARDRHIAESLERGW